MAIDYKVARDLERQFSSFAQAQAEELIYMPRFTQDNMPYGFCSRCYDERTDQITDANCEVCFGTGFTGGYDSPLTGVDAFFQRVHGFLSPNVFVTDWQASGPISNEENQKVFLKIDPQPALSDLVIDCQGNRYRIGTEGIDWSFGDIRVGWVAVIFQQTVDSIVYKVPIPDRPILVRPNSRSNRIELQFIQENPLNYNFNS